MPLSRESRGAEQLRQGIENRPAERPARVRILRRDVVEHGLRQRPDPVGDLRVADIRGDALPTRDIQVEPARHRVRRHDDDLRRERVCQRPGGEFTAEPGLQHFDAIGTENGQGHGEGKILRRWVMLAIIILDGRLTR